MIFVATSTGIHLIMMGSAYEASTARCAGSKVWLLHTSLHIQRTLLQLLLYLKLVPTLPRWFRYRNMATAEGVKKSGQYVFLPELLEDVLSFIHHPGVRDAGLVKKDLSSCCLVSRQWHIIARPHLFQSVTFKFADYEDSNAHLAPGRDVIRREATASLSSFRDFLLSSPTIASHIQNLNLSREIDWTTLPPGSNLDPLCAQTASVNLLQSLLSHLPHLQHVTLSGIRPEGRPSRVAVPGPYTPRAIQSLFITQMSGIMPLLQFQTEDMLALLELFSEVKRVHLHFPFGLDYMRRGEIPDTMPATTKILSLVVGSLHNSRSLLPTLQKYINTNSLTSVHLPAACIMRQPPSNFTAAQAFLGCGIGAQLSNFGVEWGAKADTQLLGHLLSLCSSLRSVTISCAMLYHSRNILWRHEETLIGIARLVEAIPPSIGRVVLELQLTRVDVPETDAATGNRPQTVVDDAFVNRFGTHMPVLHIRPLGTPTRSFDQGETEKLRSLFPKIMAAGRLRF